MTAKPGRTLRALLQDLIEWGERASRVLSLENTTRLADDLVVQLALERAVEVVGEIASELMRRYPEWSQSRRVEGLLGASRMRNRLAHAYGDIDPILLAGIAAEDVRDLTARARLWLEELNG